MINHDRIFKEFLRAFCAEFIELFFPLLAAFIDLRSLRFLDKEIFTKIIEGERYEADLVVLAVVRGGHREIVILIEPQNKPAPVFPRRMFNYVSELHLDLDLQVYPIALMTYDQPFTKAPSEYTLEVAGQNVITFKYGLVQLNQLDWRQYRESNNPAAVALMAKMRMQPEERKQVKVECLTRLMGLGLDPYRTELIAGFVNVYLRLTPEEEEWVMGQVKAATKAEETEPLFWTYWHEKGHEKGRREEVLRMAHKLLRRTVGEIDPAAEERMAALTTEQLEDLCDALLDFRSAADLDRWLEQVPVS